MKHAYLIMAHEQFELLGCLLVALDDERNDIYVHFDKKVRKLPPIRTEYAHLYILDDRIDVRWGDISQIETGYLLFETAFKNGPYAYYHTLSGVDMPLKSQNDIHSFFLENKGKEFIGFYQGSISKGMDFKVRRYHLFPKHFRSSGTLLSVLYRNIRSKALGIQSLLGIRRHKEIDFKKGASWVSVTQDFIAFLLPKYGQVMNTYRNTYCADEIFLHTICWGSPFRDRLFDERDEQRGCMRMIGWQNNTLIDWKENDYEKLMSSGVMFARKFNAKDIKVVYRILNTIKAIQTHE